MAHFQYKGRNPQGNLVEGRLEAATGEAAADQLLRRGIIPVDVKEARGNGDGFSLKNLLISDISLEELVIFSRQMYSLTKAGIPILRAITGLRDTTGSKKLVSALADIASELESGRTLSTAMSQHPRIFSRMFVSLVHVGENTGNLEQAFLQLSGYLEGEQETRKQIKSAMRYPTFVLLALSAALVVLNIWVIPTFAGMFSKFGVELPWSTRALLASSSFFVNYWPVMAGGLFGLVVWVKYWLTTTRGRLQWDRYKLKLPVVGSVIQRALLARFGRSFAMMIASGVPLLQGLGLVADAVDNAHMKQKIESMARGVKSGESLLRVSRSSELFTPLVLQMIAVGEETGRIEELLNSVAEFYEREVDFELKSMTSKIEPILTVAVAGMVLILALGIFTPMWDMMGAVG